ncbi:SH3 domain-containing protein [Methylocystis sp. JAN1]|uniref:SH3 domain-containing protein n=1 Tax=Methylocystis sp. JAN1 TaxID=3397211 RepID=UPI003FA335DD
MKSALLRFAALSTAVTAGAALAAPVTSPANVRSGPSAKWPVIAVIPAGADVRVLNCGGGWKRDWCRVAYGQTKGYVAAGVLAPSGANNVVVAPVVTTELANIYKGPGVNYPVVAVAPGGATVNKGGCVPGWQTHWCQVNYNGKVGYMMENLLEREGSLFPM